MTCFNAGEARIFGGEFDVIARPWRGGTLHFGTEYADSRSKSFEYTQPAAFLEINGCRVTPTGTVGAAGPVVSVDCSGQQVARTPLWSGSAGYRHELPLPNGASVLASADATFASARWLSVEFEPLERAGSYAALNTSLTYQAQNRRWSVTGFVRNVTDASVFTFAVASPFSAAVLSNIGPPRMYGARFAVNFGAVQ